MDRHDEIRKAAIGWHVRVTGGSATAEELRRFAAWLEVPLNRAAYDRIATVWSAAGPAAEIVRAAAQQQGSAKTQSRRWFIGAMGTAVAASAAYLVVRPMWILAPELRTQSGERRTFVLNDGSSVMLNSSTLLRTRVNNAERKVQLTGGEALFSVVPDISRPFSIATPVGEITVVGTEFSVWSRATDDLTLTVLSGVVTAQPDATGASMTVRAGEQLAWNATSVGAIGKVDANKALAWRTGHVVYENATLQDVALDFERYYGIRARVDDARAAMRPVNGIFQLGSLDSFAHSIETVFQVRFDRSDNDMAVIRTHG